MDIYMVRSRHLQSFSHLSLAQSPMIQYMFERFINNTATEARMGLSVPNYLLHLYSPDHPHHAIQKLFRTYLPLYWFFKYARVLLAFIYATLLEWIYAAIKDEIEVDAKILGHKGGFSMTYVNLRNKATGEVIAEGRHALYGHQTSKL